MVAPGDFIGPYRVLAEISRLASRVTYLVEHPAQGPAAPAFLTIWPEILLRSPEEVHAFSEACQKIKEEQAGAFPLLASGVEHEIPYLLLSEQQTGQPGIALIDQRLGEIGSGTAPSPFPQDGQEGPQPQPKPRAFLRPVRLAPSRIMGTRRGRFWAGVVSAFVIASVAITALYSIEPASAATVTLLPKSRHIQQSLQVLVFTQSDQVGDIRGQLISYTTPTQTQTAQATGTIHQDATYAKGSVVISQISLNAGGSTDIGASTLDSNSGVSIVLEPFTAVDGGTVTVAAQAKDSGSAGNLSAYDIDFPVDLCTAFDVLCAHPIGQAYAQNPNSFTGGQDASDQPVVMQSDIDTVTSTLSAELTSSAKAGLAPLLAQYVQPGKQTALPTPECTPTIQADHQAGDIAPTVTVSGTVTCYQIVYAQQDFLPGVIHAQQQQVDDAYGQGYSLVGAMLAAPPTFQSTAGTGATLLVKTNSIWVYQVDDVLKAQVSRQIVGKTQSDARGLLLHLHADIQAVTFGLQGFGSKLPTDARAIHVTVQAVAGLRAEIEQVRDCDGASGCGPPRVISTVGSLIQERWASDQ
jgi:hypothetical protein